MKLHWKYTLADYEANVNYFDNVLLSEPQFLFVMKLEIYSKVVR